MDVYLPPLARRIKHPEGLIEQRIDRMAGNPSLSLSPARVRELLQRRLKQRWRRRRSIKTAAPLLGTPVEYTWAWHRTAAARTQSTLARRYPLTHRTLPFGGQTERKANVKNPLYRGGDRGYGPPSGDHKRDSELRLK